MSAADQASMMHSRVCSSEKEGVAVDLRLDPTAVQPHPVAAAPLLPRPDDLPASLTSEMLTPRRLSLLVPFLAGLPVSDMGDCTRGGQAGQQREESGRGREG